MPPVAAVHAKVLIVDRIVDGANVLEAYVIGSPFVQDYFDGPSHSLHDERHGEARLCVKVINVPTHDVSVRLRGPAIAHLDDTFRLHWNQVKPTAAAELLPAPQQAIVPNGATTQVTRSLWGGGRFVKRPHGETSIYESYLRAIAKAEDYVYLENQYFTLDKLTDALVRAVKNKPGLEIILLTNNKVDIPFYPGWHPTQVTRLLTGLTPQERKRVGVFTLWTHEAGLGPPPATSRVGRVYVHSKVAIVDDVWATIGSANLDGVSLLASDHVGRFNQDVRATEANIVVLGSGAGGTPTDLPATLRMRLWAEHLGLTAAGAPADNVTRLVARPAGGWVGLWNERWEAKKASLLSDPATLHPSRVLTWPANEDGVIPGGSDSAEGYLNALGIEPKGSLPNFKTVETFDFYDSKSGQWA